MKVTLGGDRLGSGNKNNLHLHNYYRSTHNLSQSWTSPMTVGALYPFLVLPAMRNDKFEIELKADAVTIPTVGPLFGSFKMQTDLFFCPIRLYQAILHNNPTNIGLKMNQVLLPTYKLKDVVTASENVRITGHAINNSALWKYLGLSGIGQCGSYTAQGGGIWTGVRYINAVPLLAYYDIFKNYYSNKQEEKAYVIGTVGQEYVSSFSYEILLDSETIDDADNQTSMLVINSIENDAAIGESKTLKLKFKLYDDDDDVFIDFNSINEKYEVISKIDIWLGQNATLDLTINDFLKNKSFYPEGIGAMSVVCSYDEESKTCQIQVFNNNEVASGWQWTLYANKKFANRKNIQLKEFALSNIDDMRMAILSHHTLGSAFAVDQQNYKPYNLNNIQDSQNPLNGLVVKTYQSDLFNNWVNTEWIDGENGIAEITKIATSDGAFKIDQLNLAEKLYNMLNRVAVAGGTYEDWQDAVYDEAPHKHIESPIYLGGMSSEIVFEQIVQTAPGGEEEPLGTLAGRGRHIKRKGGHIICKCDEAGFIIGIVSITPRIKYHQGNEFYLTELKSLDDLHKPALDGIGFQNLLGERLAWWDTTMKADGTYQLDRHVVGKVPAWIEYMTAVDKTFGDFAEQDGKAYMVLNRNYEYDDDNETIADVTTYIDPTKYNYAFAYSSLDAQNFWVEIYSNITARRKMSAKQIPNL